ncbi:MAG: peptidoglycan glycosyltransferase FtsW [Rhabdochlamydiaceae bacterium]
MNKYALGLLVCVSSLFGLGVLMVFNTTSAEVLNRSLPYSTHHALIKQIIYAFIGLMGATGIWIIGYKNVVKSIPVLFCVFIFLLLLVFIPGIGLQINGAHRWIGVKGLSFQPSEFAKYIIPFYFIYELSKREYVCSFSDLVKILVKILIPLFLILVEPDNGTVALVLATLIVLLILTKVKWQYWIIPLFVVLLAGGLVASRMEHVHDRIRIFLHPEDDLRGKGHQPYQAKIAAGSGGLMGKGLGQSLQKLDYLPEARSDYIAAIFAEEFGFIGMTAVIILYMLITFFGFTIATQASTIEGAYIVSTCIFLLSIQAFLNLGVVCGLLPSKGTNLPFFSQGGSSLMVNLLALSLVLNVSYLSDKAKNGI